MKIRKALIYGCLLLLPLLAQSATYYVATNGVDGRIGTDWSTAVATISNAVGALAIANGDVVLVSNGTYIISEEILIDRGITVRGFSGEPRDVLIDGNDAVRCVRIWHSGATLADLTVTNGRTSSGDAYVGGAGIYVSLSSGGTISNCHISGNNAFGDGGGLMFSERARIYGCHVYGNHAAGNGGGLRLAANNPLTATSIIEQCVVYDNVADGNGGGIYARNSFIEIRNSVISNNMAVGDGAGIWLENYESNHFSRLINVAVCENKADNNAGGIYLHRGNGLIDGCIISNNSAAVQCAGVMLTAPRTAGHSRSIILNSIIIGNTGNGYGAVRSSSAIISNCFVIRNVSTNNNGLGAGIYAGDATELYNCLVAGNTNSHDMDRGGAGMHFYQMTGKIHNCTIAGNTTQTSGGGIWFSDDYTNEFLNCIIFGNTAGNSGTEDIGWRTGRGSVTNNFARSCSAIALKPDSDNISADPLFADPGNGNFRLQAGSPCVNAGLNREWMTDAVDLDGRPRLDRFTRLVDMGCYEYVWRGTMFNLK